MTHCKQIVFNEVLVYTDHGYGYGCITARRAASEKIHKSRRWLWLLIMTHTHGFFNILSIKSTVRVIFIIKIQENLFHLNVQNSFHEHAGLYLYSLKKTLYSA